MVGQPGPAHGCPDQVMSIQDLNGKRSVVKTKLLVRWKNALGSTTTVAKRRQCCAVFFLLLAAGLPLEELDGNHQTGEKPAGHNQQMDKLKARAGFKGIKGCVEGQREVPNRENICKGG